LCLQLKGKKSSGERDLYKDKKGDIYVKPKGGKGEGEPTGVNINDFRSVSPPKTIWQKIQDFFKSKPKSNKRYYA
jgi:hypothetical protein